MVDGVPLWEHFAAGSYEVDSRLHFLEIDREDLSGEDLDCAFGASHYLLYF